MKYIIGDTEQWACERGYVASVSFCLCNLLFFCSNVYKLYTFSTQYVYGEVDLYPIKLFHIEGGTIYG